MGKRITRFPKENKSWWIIRW